MTAAALIDAVGVWLWVGAGVAVLFLTVGVDRIDPDARGAYVFRLLLIPGILMLWPLVLWRWAREETGRARWQGRYSPPRAHGALAVAMGVVIALTLIVSLSIRQTWPDHIAPQQIAETGG